MLVMPLSHIGFAAGVSLADNGINVIHRRDGGSAVDDRGLELDLAALRKVHRLHRPENVRFKDRMNDPYGTSPIGFIIPVRGRTIGSGKGLEGPLPACSPVPLTRRSLADRSPAPVAYMANIGQPSWVRGRSHNSRRHKTLQASRGKFARFTGRRFVSGPRRGIMADQPRVNSIHREPLAGKTGCY